MDIRLGESWRMSPGNSWYVTEVRRHWFDKPEWDYRGAAKECLASGAYLIFNQCLGYNKTMPHPEYLPTEQEWRARIEENVQMLIYLGANKNNCIPTLINEPTKFFRVENGYNGVNDLIYYTNIMYDQIAGRFDIGSGNMEFYDAMVLGDWLRHLCRDGKFKYLLIHIQNSCDTEEHTRQYTDYAKGLADMYGKKLSCSEAMHTGWDMASSDYNKLLMQLSHAERVGCQDFCVICLDLDTNAAKQELDLSKLGEEPCFKIDGNDRSNGHYDDLKRIADEKAPVPNIIEIKGSDGMIIETVGPLEQDIDYGNRVTLLHRLLVATGYMTEDEIDKYYQYDDATEQAVKDFQTALKQTMPWISIDGRIGRQTYDLLIAEVPDASERDALWRTFKIYNSPRNSEGDM